MNLAEQIHTLLIIDDDEIFCDTVLDALSPQRFQVFTAHTRKKGLEICKSNRIDVVLLDQKLPDGDGHELCPHILEFNEHSKIIFVTAYPSFDNAVNAIKAGAYDYLSKPFNLEELRLTIHRSLDLQKLERVQALESYRIDKERGDNVLVGDFGGSTHFLNMIRLASSTDSPVLITGETGTGKNVVASAIHFNDLRRDSQSPFIKVNCAALPENLIEDELFGHEKGAFTDASASRKGLFELADGGTLLLDEIGDMPLHLQAKLLGVLDDGKIRRLGGQSTIPVNVRIIAATNSSLEQAITEKTFRQDLYYRLSVIRLHIPPLRERISDLPELCRFFIDKMTGLRKPRLPDPELKLLMTYGWPGNVRELKNIIERSLLLHYPELRPSELIETGRIPLQSLTEMVDAVSGNLSPADDSSASGQGSQPDAPRDGVLKTLEQMEREHIARALESLDYNYTQSARALGISLSTLKRKVKGYGLRAGDQMNPGDAK